ncbi:Ribosomal RNA small subunit methyltransferase [Trichinella pseudospiralis]
MFVVISYQVYPIRGTVFGWLTPHQLRGSFDGGGGGGGGGGDLIKDRKSNGTMLPLQPSVPNEPCLYQLFRPGIDRLCCFACN